MNPYQELGVDAKADAATIKRAYRRKRSQVHPDKGGSAKAFVPLQRAYELLCDPIKRQRFDETGEAEDGKGLPAAASVLASMLLQLVDGVDLDHNNIVELMRKAILEKEAGSKRETANLRARLKKRESAIRRIRHNGQGDNLLASILEGDIRIIERQIASIEEGDAFSAQLLKMLDDYAYQADIVVPMPMGMRSTTSTSSFG